MGQDADAEEFKLEIFENSSIDYDIKAYRLTSRENIKVRSLLIPNLISFRAY